MFERMNRSWELVKASWDVLKADKELLVYPVVSFIGSILVLITFAIPIIATGLLGGLEEGDSPNVLFYVVMFLFYLVTYSVVIFCNTALVGAAMIRLKGGDPTVADGFRIASSHAGNIIGYALISATIGLVLRWIADRGILGRIVASLLGTAWSIATFLVVPVLVIENVGPIESVKRSINLLKTTWGEQLIANFGMGTVFGLMTLAVILIGGIIAAAASSISGGLALGIVVVVIVAVLLIGLISSALGGIYQCALYLYATDGTVQGFDAETIRYAFAEKPKRGLI
jgi:hypothetical protein